MNTRQPYRYAPIDALMLVDSYKLGHEGMYRLAGNPEYVYSNWTNRGSRIPGVEHVVHFGLQAAIDQLVDAFAAFFAADEETVCGLYEERLLQILGPNTIGSEHIRRLHQFGYLPLRFCAVPEGTPVPVRVPTFTVENTEPEFFWLTNYVESALSSLIWQASTSATIAVEFRKVLDEGARRTGADLAGVDWQGHDFSFRGMSSPETAAASGAGHLLSFTGTDSMPSLSWIDRHYGGEYVAGSVSASEHSVMCALSEVVGERDAFRRLVDANPSGIISIVSDTFDLWQVLTDFLPGMKEQILARDGKLVIRPDSGDPVDILCGAPRGMRHFEGEHGQEYDVLEPEHPKHKGVVELLWDAFGGTVNDAGFKELDVHIGAIYGDSITLERAQRIIDRLADKGFASTNVVFGIGSFTYQYNTRDTFMSAMKATWAQVDGVGYELQKDPVTDSGTKRSARGRLAVARDQDGELTLIQQATPEQEAASLLQPVWADGEFVQHQSFAEVRAVLAEALR